MVIPKEIPKPFRNTSPHSEKLLILSEKLKRMREIGIEAWIEELEREGRKESCP